MNKNSYEELKELVDKVKDFNEEKLKQWKLENREFVQDVTFLRLKDAQVATWKSQVFTQDNVKDPSAFFIYNLMCHFIHPDMNISKESMMLAVDSYYSTKDLYKSKFDGDLL